MLTFANPGLIDPQSITTFGINAKETKNPIGFFGTGLKYAIAVILRLGGRIEIETQSGGHAMVYSFFTRETEIRGKTFHRIEMSVSGGDIAAPYTIPLAFTTELGKNWQPWQAYRELRSNMQDEGGSFDTHLLSPCTYITVHCPEVEEAHEQSPAFFLDPAAKPLWENDKLQVFPAQADAPLFYRGIRVAAASAPSLYTYNLLSPQSLTEDRTLDTWSFGYATVQALGQCDDSEIAERILLADHFTWEASFNFDYVPELSQTMRDAIKLHADNEALNAGAKRRSKALYPESWVPKLLPMTKTQKAKVHAAVALVTAFGDNLPWMDVRLAELDDYAETQIIEDTLYISQDLLEGEEFLQTFVGKFLSARSWSSEGSSSFVLKILRHALPRHKAWAFEAQPSGEPRAEPEVEAKSENLPF